MLLLFTPIVRAQLVSAGIYSSSYGILEIRAKSTTNITTSAYSNMVVTLRWLTSYGITLGVVTSGTMTTGESTGVLASGPPIVSGSYTYQIYVCIPGSGSITWTAGLEYLLFSVPVSGGLGMGVFEIINDDVTSSNNGNWYFEIGGSDYTNYSTPFYCSVAGYVPLLVEMTSFAASASRLTVDLKWSTATEKNNYGFDIERRSVEVTNESWTKVGFVQGAGTSNVQQNYLFSDATAHSGRYVYRLKMIDNDGTFKYSQSQEVEIGLAPKKLTLCNNYPNPFNPTTNIEFTVAADGKAVLKVYNTLGQEVAELYNGVAQAGRIIQTHFDASRFASGIYFSRLEAGGKSLVKRMMFVK